MFTKTGCRMQSVCVAMRFCLRGAGLGVILLLGCTARTGAVRTRPANATAAADVSGAGADSYTIRMAFVTVPDSNSPVNPSAH